MNVLLNTLNIHWIAALLLALPIFIGSFSQKRYFPVPEREVRLEFALHVAATIACMSYYGHVAYRWDEAKRELWPVIGLGVNIAVTAFLGILLYHLRLLRRK